MNKHGQQLFWSTFEIDQWEIIHCCTCIQCPFVLKELVCPDFYWFDVYAHTVLYVLSTLVINQTLFSLQKLEKKKSCFCSSVCF